MAQIYEKIPVLTHNLKNTNQNQICQLGMYNTVDKGLEEQSLLHVLDRNVNCNNL